VRHRPKPHRTARAAAAIVLAIPAFGIFSYIFRDTGHTTRSQTVGLGDPVAVLFEISHDAEFTFDGPGEHDNNLEYGHPVLPGVVELERGTLTFKFNCDAEVTIEGPATFGLNDDKRAHLHRGRLTAYCPPKAIGFTIGAPGVAVVDLGTRFTMLVDAFGFTDVAVLDGEVRLDRESGESVALVRGGSARAPRDLTHRIAIDHSVMTVLDATGDLRINRQRALLGAAYPPGLASLDAGEGTLQLTSGVELLLRDHAAVDVVDHRTVSVLDGAVRFDCPAQAGGLAIKLPGDLRADARRARFSVHVDPRRDLVRLVVASGEVQLTGPGREPAAAFAGDALEIKGDSVRRYYAGPAGETSYSWNIAATPSPATYAWFDARNWNDVGGDPTGDIPVDGAGNVVYLDADNVERTYDIEHGGVGVHLPNATIIFGRGLLIDSSGDDDEIVGDTIRVNGAGGVAPVFDVPVTANLLTSNRHGAVFNVSPTIGSIEAQGHHQQKWVFNAAPTAAIASIRIADTDKRGDVHDDNFTVNVDMATRAFDLEWGRITVGAGATFDVGNLQITFDDHWLVRNGGEGVQNQIILHGDMAADALTFENIDTENNVTLNPQARGTYGRIGRSGVDYNVDWIAGDGTLTVGRPVELPGHILR